MKLNKLILALVICVSSIGWSQQKPNIIVILADDIGTGDISYLRKLHSDKIVLETPAIDALAAQGMIFTDAHSPAALCAPSRYAIMTGSSCYRSYAPWGVWGAYQLSPIEKNQLTLGKLMKNAGYSTSFFGKWGFGMDFLAKDDPSKIYRSDRNKIQLNVDVTKVVGSGPKQNGFDYSLLFPAGIQDVPYTVYENEQWMKLKENSEITFISQENMTKIGVKLDKDEGLGDSNWDPHNMGPLMASKAVEFIEKSSSAQPFFMYYCSLAVHLPHSPSKELNGKKIANSTPSHHLDMVKELDVQIEMMVETLKKKGIYDNTLIIFTSDNGGLLEKETAQAGHKTSDIYRGGKNQAYEGGHRIPFIASWPGKIKAKSISNVPVIGLDILATLASITNQKIEKDQAMDSSNLSPILFENSKTNVHSHLMLQSGTGKEVMIIEDGWKLIIQLDKKDKTDTVRTPFALFNLKENPSEDESKNLIADPKQSAKVAQLFEKYNKTRDSKVKTRL